MHYHERGGADFKGALAYLAGINWGVVDGSGLEPLVADEVILGVELCGYLHNSTYVQHRKMWSWVAAAALRLATDDTNFT